MVVRLTKNGSFEAIEYKDLKKGDVFVQKEGEGPRVWIAILDYGVGDNPDRGLRCEPLENIADHIVDPAPVTRV